MFSMCSKLTPRAPIPDSRIAQFMQPWLVVVGCRQQSSVVIGSHRQSLDSHWIVIRKSSDSYRIVIGQSSDSHRLVIGQSSDSHHSCRIVISSHQYSSVVIGSHWQSSVVICRLLRLIRLDLQWRGRLHSYMWGWTDGWLSQVVGGLRAPSVLIK